MRVFILSGEGGGQRLGLDIEQHTAGGGRALTGRDPQREKTPVLFLRPSLSHENTQPAETLRKPSLYSGTWERKVLETN